MATNDNVRDDMVEKTEKQYVTVATDRLNFRAKPDKGSAVIEVLTRGTRLEVLEDFDADWFYVKTTVGKRKEGFVMREFVKKV